METFVIRVWTPADPEPAGVLRGFVHHVGSARECGFRQTEELVAFIRDRLDELGADEPRR